MYTDVNMRVWFVAAAKRNSHTANAKSTDFFPFSSEEERDRDSGWVGEVSIFIGIYWNTANIEHPNTMDNLKWNRIYHID